MDRVYIIWYMTGDFTAGYTDDPSEIMRVVKEPSKVFTNNRLGRSGWRCCFRDSTASKVRLETVEWSMRMLGAHPERYGDQDVDHEQDESLPTDIKGSYQLSIRQERGLEASVTHIQLVLPSAKAVKDMSSRVSILDGALRR
jgi:hypothetical protein